MRTGTSDGRRRLFAVVAVLVLAVAAFGTAAAFESEETDAATTATGTAKVGSSYSETFSLSTTAEGNDFLNWKVTVSPSSSKGLSATASLSSSGSTLKCDLKVSGTPSSSGTVTFTATANYTWSDDDGYSSHDDSKTFSVTITIEDATLVTSISLNYTSRSVTVGSTTTVTATTSPDDADDRHVTWKITSGSSYISISSSDTTTGGKVTVTGVKAGTATIQATAADGSGVTSKECTITVSNPSYTATLKYNANGGSGAPSNDTYTSTSTSSHTFTISTTVPTRDGYTFLGWSTSSSATSASYQPGGTISVGYNSTTTLYAVWAVQTFTVTFWSDGQVYSQQTVTYGSTVTPPDDPGLSGMFFTGWYSDEDCTQTFDFLSTLTSDLDLYAGWVEELAFVTIPTIDVVIERNDGTLTADASASTDWQRIAWYVDGCLACYGECVTLSLPSGTHYVMAVASNTEGASMWGDYVEVPDEDDGGIPWLLLAAGVVVLLCVIVAIWRHAVLAMVVAALLAVVALAPYLL